MSSPWQGDLTGDLLTGGYVLSGSLQERRFWDEAEQDEEEEVILGPNGRPVAFPEYVRLGYVRVVVAFNGCADEGDIGEVWFWKDGAGVVDGGVSFDALVQGRGGL